MYIADLHIHSRFSRATSKEGDAPHLDLWARRKGHRPGGHRGFYPPAWRAELREQLAPAEPAHPAAGICAAGCDLGRGAATLCGDG